MNTHSAHPVLTVNIMVYFQKVIEVFNYVQRILKNQKLLTVGNAVIYFAHRQ